MHDPTMTNPLCLMDWHGQLLSHNPVMDALTLVPITPGTLPDLTIKTPPLLSLPSPVVFIKHIPMPKAFPELILTDAGNGYVALFSPATQRYITCLPFPENNQHIDFRTDQVNAWEKLIRLSHTAFRGLSLLMLPERCTIALADGTIVPALTLHPRSNLGQISTYTFQLADNLAVFESIGLLAPGQALDVTLHCSDPEQTLRVRVQCL